MKTGRNDFCPCGSGKKYKKCCLDGKTAGAGPAGLTPAEVVAARSRAFAEEDFGLIFDSYHPDSPFRQHFPDRQEYLLYAREELISADEVRVLFYLDVRHDGEGLESVELSRFLKRGGAWLYFSGCKVARSVFAGPLESIEPAEVERLAEGISF
jgi:SEC-C motif-containing protein